MRALLPILTVAAMAFPTLASAGERPINKVEARSLPTAETKRRVLAQFSEALTEMPRPKRRGRPTQPLSDLWYTTRPRSTDYVGLCSYDTVVFKFHPVADGTRTATTPVRADGVEAHTSYRFTKSPSFVSDDGPPVTARDHAACGRIDRNNARFFRAPDEETALSAGRRLADLMNRLRENPKDTVLTVECSGLAEEECRTLISTIDPNSIESADRCSSAARDGECWEIDAYGPRGLEYSLDLVGPIGDKRTTKVILNQLVTFADERRD
jgi:hypothetical protein